MASLTDLFARGFQIGQNQRSQEVEERFRETQREKILSDMALRNRKVSPKFGAAFSRVTDPDVPLSELQGDLAELYVDLPSFREALRTRNDRIAFRTRLERDAETARVQRELADIQLETARQRGANVEAAGGRTLDATGIRDRLLLRYPNITDEELDKRMSRFSPNVAITETEFDNIIGKQGTPINATTLRKNLRSYVYDQIAAIIPNSIGRNGEMKEEYRTKWLRVTNEAVSEMSGATEIDYKRVNELMHDYGLVSKEQRGWLDRNWERAKGVTGKVAGALTGGEDRGSVEGAPAPSDSLDTMPAADEQAVDVEALIEKDYQRLNSEIEDETELGQQMLTLLAERGILDDRSRKEALDFVRTRRNREETAALGRAIGGVAKKVWNVRGERRKQQQLDRASEVANKRQLDNLDARIRREVDAGRRPGKRLVLQAEQLRARLEGRPEPTDDDINSIMDVLGQ